MTWYVIAAGALAILILAFVVWSNTRKPKPIEPPPLGIVLLLNEPKPLNATDVADVLSRVNGTPFLVVPPQAGRPMRPADLPQRDLVLGESPSFLVQAAGDLFVVNSVAKPYGTQLEGLAVREHQAWLSVEILHPEAASAPNYRIVGKAVAELLAGLMNEDCIALYHPESKTVVPFQPDETSVRLKSENPLHAVFGV